MIAPEASEEARSRCRGYTDFRAKLKNDPDYARPFEPVLDYIDGLGEDTAAKVRRLTLIHNALVDLIDFLDRHRVWVEGPRDKLPVPEVSAESTSEGELEPASEGQSRAGDGTDEAASCPADRQGGASGPP